MSAAAILLFVKYPAPGRVKTRLAATVGAEAAAAAYRCLAEEVCSCLPVETAVFVLFDPAEQRADVERWLGSHVGDRARFLPQVAGDLGSRLEAGFEEAFASGFGKVAAIGSDCIELSAETFSQTWKKLDTHDCVIGPSTDGGYYLIALKARCAALFRDIPWSSAETFAATTQRVREVGFAVHLLPEQSDVDTENDWNTARGRLRFSSPPLH